MTSWATETLNPDLRAGRHLFRESDVKTGMFIISHVKKSSAPHLVTLNKNREFIRLRLEEAFDMAVDVMASSDSYHHGSPSQSW